MMNIFSKIFCIKRKKQELADRKRRLLYRIRYDTALLHREAARQPFTAKQ